MHPNIAGQPASRRHPDRVRLRATLARMLWSLDGRERRPQMASSMAAGAPRSARRAERTGWYGWIVFAGTMMLMLGSFHAVAGLVALFKDDYYLVRPSGLVVNVDYTTWGWTHIVLGLVIAGAGFGLFVGAMWARVVAVLV